MALPYVFEKLKSPPRALSQEELNYCDSLAWRLQYAQAAAQYQNRAAQFQSHPAAAQYQNRAAQFQSHPAAPTWHDINTLKAEDPVRMKLTRVISRLVDALPMAVVWEMAQPKCEIKGRQARVTVKFHTGAQIEFVVDDKFPADEHLARIALECP